MNYILFFIIINCCHLLYCLPEAIGKSFDIFIQQYVPALDQKNFASYYEKLMQEMKELKRPEKEAYLDSIRIIGSSSIETKDRKLFEQIQMYIYNSNPLSKRYDIRQAKEIRTFLVRYGAFEKYKEEQLVAQARPWNKVQSFFKNIGTQVSCWFNSIKVNPFA